MLSMVILELADTYSMVEMAKDTVRSEFETYGQVPMLVFFQARRLADAQPWLEKPVVTMAPLVGIAKDALPELVRRLAKRFGARALVLAAGAFIARFPDTPDVEAIAQQWQGRLHEHPESREAVMLRHETMTGTAVEIAYVTDVEGKRTLGEFAPCVRDQWGGPMARLLPGEGDA